MEMEVECEELTLLRLYLATPTSIARPDQSSRQDRDIALENTKNGKWFSQIDAFKIDLLNLTRDPESFTVTPEKYTEVLCAGICHLNAFCEINWTGRTEENDSETADPEDSIASDILYGEDPPSKIHGLNLLRTSLCIFKSLLKNYDKLAPLWWKLRTLYVIQTILEDNHRLLFDEIETTVRSLSRFENILSSHPDLRVVLNLEICQIYLTYRRIERAGSYLERAKNVAHFASELKGALGKRTKFQQTSLPQMIVETAVGDADWKIPAEKTHGNVDHLPVAVKLDDDLRLESVEFENPVRHRTLTALEQSICLITARYNQISQPRDLLNDEEVLPYLTLLLNQKYCPWSVRVHTFLMKCKLESNHKRTVERAMMQCEEIVNNFKVKHAAGPDRLSLLWASGLPPFVKWRSLLADLLLSIGLVKSALDIYLDLQLWEDVIVCYTMLELPQKAAEIIRREIEIKPTAKLYCLLGDATDDPSLYEKAWEFSKHKSGRAQRHWGNYLYAHKKYEESISHYEKSLEINSLQEIVWLRLGYAALCAENWEIAANAYRRHTYLEPHSFAAWNNLAKIYVKQGNKERAHKALSEALKFNYNNWQIWENMVVVSMDTGHFEDVIRGYRRLLELKNKHLDIEILSLLVKAVLTDAMGADKNGAKRLMPRVSELFSEVTLAHQNDPTLWQLYADISPTANLRAQRLLNCYRATTQSKTNWATDPEICERILDIVEDLSKNSLRAKEEAKEPQEALSILSSARLTLQGVIRNVKNQNWPQYDERLSSLQTTLENLTTEVKNLS